MARSSEEREQSYLLIAENLKAYEVMGINSGIAESPGRYINDIIKGDMYDGMGRTITISQFLKYYYREEEGSVFGVVRLVNKPEIDKSKPEKERDVICVEGGAVMNGSKLAGYLTGEEMRGFNFIVDEVKSCIITFETPEELIESEKLIAKSGELSSIKVFKSKTKKK